MVEERQYALLEEFAGDHSEKRINGNGKTMELMMSELISTRLLRRGLLRDAFGSIDYRTLVDWGHRTLASFRRDPPYVVVTAEGVLYTPVLLEHRSERTRFRGAFILFPSEYRQCFEPVA